MKINILFLESPLNVSMAVNPLSIFTANPNILQRRRSQDGPVTVKKAKPLEFEDLWNLKQKLISTKKKQDDDDSLYGSKEEMKHATFSPSPTKLHHYE